MGLGWYFGTAGRVSEGRAFIEAALESVDAAPLPLLSCLYVCYLATEGTTSRLRSRRGSVASGSQ